MRRSICVVHDLHIHIESKACDLYLL
jgi:hypothetical protein